MRTLMIASLAPTVFALTTLALPAMAQVAPYPYGAQNYGPNTVATGDIHRYEMDRLRARSDANESLARSQSLSTRLTLQELQARRATSPAVEPYQPPRLRSVEQESAAREAATARRETTARNVGQIDAWLDRAPQ